MTTNEFIAFGGVAFLALIGFIVAWNLVPGKDKKAKK